MTPVAAYSASALATPRPSFVTTGAHTLSQTKSKPDRPRTDYWTYPLIRQGSRTYLRDPAQLYPLPCDIPEIHRQNLRTLLLLRVFGGPFCSPYSTDNPPKRVLEVACGSGLWSNLCHDFFASHGHPDVSFTGIDIVSLAPDLCKSEVNWQFKRHDLRSPRLPFPNDYFDFVFIKDAGMCPSSPAQGPSGLSEPLRVLRPGGILEVWDSDWVFRSLLPNPAPARKPESREQAIADRTGTYTFSSATPFTSVQDRFLKEYNQWAETAFDRRKLSPLPCATVGLSFNSQMDALGQVDSRRIAIPLGELRWERDGQGQTRKSLTDEQLNIRRTATRTVIEMIEGMEPILMEASGKNRSEWRKWWTAMTADLLQEGGCSTGECLEVSAWWGRKK